MKKLLLSLILVTSLTASASAPNSVTTEIAQDLGSIAAGFGIEALLSSGGRHYINITGEFRNENGEIISLLPTMTNVKAALISTVVAHTSARLLEGLGIPRLPSFLLSHVVANTCYYHVFHWLANRGNRTIDLTQQQRPLTQEETEELERIERIFPDATAAEQQQN